MSSAIPPPAPRRRRRSQPYGRPGQRRAWVFPALVAIVAALAITEVWVLIQLGQAIGVLWTLLVLVIGALVGAWLIRREGSRAWRALTGALSSGQLPAGQLADAALVFVGGALLILPGLVSDVVGLLFLLPFTRPLIRRLVATAIARRIANSEYAVLRARVDRSNLIEGETVGDESSAASGRPADPRNVVIRGEISDDGR